MTSSMSSQKLAFLGITNEFLASNNLSSLSTSIATDDEMGQSTFSFGKKDIDCDEDEMSSRTITAGYSNNLTSSTSKISPSKDQKETVNDAFLKQRQSGKIGSICRKDLFIDVDEKFAETVAASNNLDLLDDETSPSDSMISSTESGEIAVKKTKENSSKIIEETKEDLEDISPELVEDLVSPVSPTHASNSLSLSDGGRDFLIDDEIADQPGLMISDKKKGSPSHHEDFKSIATTSDATPTLRDISAHGSIKSLNKTQMMRNFTSSPSPLMLKKQFDRTGSLDTLSPCDSIASDDLMADFEIASSVDSMDR